jgi:DNA (cytosine-5)-methyltransferase 1
MNVLSLFSGVGGFDLGLENAGMKTIYQCEWDKHANSILERHWPHVPRWGDITTLTGKEILSHGTPPDVVAWGSPCQDLSVAGKRAGLEGERSGLFHEGIRIINELRKETNNEYPKISIWENVAGALSSNRGADFGVILNEMAKAGAMVIEWALLDAQHFGIPQRRRRVFVIAIFNSATASICPSPLLPVSESLRGNLKKGKPKRKGAASETSESLGTGGQWAAGTTDDGDILRTSVTSKWSKGSGGPSGSEYYNMVVEDKEIVGALAARDYKGVGSQYVDEGKVIVQPFVKSRRAQTATDDETWVPGEVNPTLNSFDVGDTRSTTVVVGSLQARDYKGVNHEGARDGKLIIEQSTYAFDSLSSNSMKSSNPNSGCNEVDVAKTLDTWKPDPSLNQGGIAIVEEPVLFENSYRDGARIADDGVTQTLTSKMGTGGGNTPMIAYGIQGTMIGRQDHNGPGGTGVSKEDGPMYTLTKTDTHAVMQEPPMAVRRLTPLECERLMGWPDDHTRYKADGTEQADTHRYKQCGNGVASPVAEWIGKQLMKLETSLEG